MTYLVSSISEYDCTADNKPFNESGLMTKDLMTK